MVNCEPDNSLWADLAKKNNFIPLIKANLEIAKNRNKNIFNVDGGHYNDLGNQIYGDSIYREIIKIHKFN